MVTDTFWRNTNVFLTGHTGFKGGWLALWLRALNARVVGYSLAPETSPNLFTSARVGETLQSHTADIRNRNSLQSAMQVAQPQVVFHLAAQPLVRRSYADPHETYETNVMGTVNLLEAVRITSSVRAVVIVTSDKCYENRERPWGYRENEPMGGYDPYSSSKGCAELVTAAYRRSFFFPNSQHKCALASVRAGNVIGGGDWSEDRLLPDLLRAFTSGRPALIRNPHAVRPWQWVLEPLAGYLAVAERLCSEEGNFAEAWNFGPSDEDVIPVATIADRFAQLWGDGASWKFETTAQPHEASFLKLDSSKARSRLGWRSRVNIDAALAATIAWYRAHAAGADMQELSLRQIEQYSCEAPHERT